MLTGWQNQRLPQAKKGKDGENNHDQTHDINDAVHCSLLGPDCQARRGCSAPVPVKRDGRQKVPDGTGRKRFPVSLKRQSGVRLPSAVQSGQQGF